MPKKREKTIIIIINNNYDKERNEVLGLVRVWLWPETCCNFPLTVIDSNCNEDDASEAENKIQSITNFTNNNHLISYG